jgi:predicted nuclease of predicted toxin-antitoxin system
VHWSSLGAANAPDSEIIADAFQHRCVVFTHDLDFGITLAHSKAGGPSVIQVRTNDVSPNHLSAVVGYAQKVSVGDRSWRAGDR